MIHLRCPRCQFATLVGPGDLGQLVTCDKPRCGMVFRAVLPPSRRIPPPPLVQPLTQLPTRSFLTDPHHCNTCGGELNTPVGRRRATVVHCQKDSPDRTPCRMDVYAMVYLCPTCNPRVLLETPSYRAGQEVRCPACQSSFQAPLFDLIHEVAGDHREGAIIRICCPLCEGKLQCDTTRAGKPPAGLWVVCFHCLERIQVPPHGEPV